MMYAELNIRYHPHGWQTGMHYYLENGESIKFKTHWSLIIKNSIGTWKDRNLNMQNKDTEKNRLETQL